MNDDAGGALPDRSKRIYIMWATGFAFLGLLAIFCWYFLRPYMEVRAAVERIAEGKSISYEDEGKELGYLDEVKALGGPERAAAKCALYVRLPERLAGDDEKILAFAILFACGKPAVPWLVSLMGSRDAYVRWNTVNVLGGLRDHRAVEPLIAALKDSNPDVRCMAASALGKLKDPRAVEPLKALLADPDNNVRWAMEEAIRKIEAAAPKISSLKSRACSRSSGRARRATSG